MKKILIVFIALILISGTIFLIYKAIKGSVVSDQTEQGSKATTTKEIEKVNGNLLKKFNEELKVIQAKDSDLDGITDEEEKKLGTNPIKADSDDDGILDKDEVDIYKTNPNKADTDSDGFKDGYEALRGFNPLGTGKFPTGYPVFPTQ